MTPARGFYFDTERTVVTRPGNGSVAFAAWEFITGPLRDNPRRVGKPLLAPFQGDWSARRGHYRVRYRIDDDKSVITVVDIVDRTDVYHPGRV